MPKRQNPLHTVKIKTFEPITFPKKFQYFALCNNTDCSANLIRLHFVPTIFSFHDTQPK